MRTQHTKSLDTSGHSRTRPETGQERTEQDRGAVRVQVADRAELIEAQCDACSRTCAGAAATAARDACGGGGRAGCAALLARRWRAARATQMVRARIEAQTLASVSASAILCESVVRLLAADTCS